MSTLEAIERALAARGWSRGDLVRAVGMKRAGYDTIFGGKWLAIADAVFAALEITLAETASTPKETNDGARGKVRAQR